MHADPPCGPVVGYMDSGDILISKDQLKSELLTMPSIFNVEITNVDV